MEAFYQIKQEQSINSNTQSQKMNVCVDRDNNKV